MRSGSGGESMSNSRAMRAARRSRKMRALNAKSPAHKRAVKRLRSVILGDFDGRE